MVAKIEGGIIWQRQRGSNALAAARLAYQSMYINMARINEAMACGNSIVMA